MKLKNKIALVTGASKGIGAGVAIALAKKGCSVIINYKSDTKSAEQTMSECNKYSSNNLTLKANLVDETEVKKMIDVVRNKYSKIDILVNNAGIFDLNDSPRNMDAFKEIFKSNFFSVVATTKYSLEIMNDGKIINISSIHGRLGYGRPSGIAYASSKAAINSYTKNLAKDLAPKILVNAIAPGRVATPMWGNPDETQQNELGKVHLTQKMIQPEEIAEGVIFLLKNDAICGEILTIDGGYRLADLS